MKLTSQRPASINAGLFAATMAMLLAACGGSSPNASAPQADRVAHAAERQIHLGADAARGFHEILALGGQFDMACAAVEQTHVERVLQRLDQCAERRLRQMALRGSPREIALSGQRQKRVDLAGGNIHLKNRLIDLYYLFYRIISTDLILMIEHQHFLILL